MVEKKSIKDLFALLEESINEDIANDEEYKEAIYRRDIKLDLIEKSYSKEEFDLLQEYIEIKNELGSIQMEKAFISGFSFAIQLIMDSLQ